MKKIFYISLVSLVFVFGFTNIQTGDNCDKKALTTASKKELKPFKYDSQKFTKIVLEQCLNKMESIFNKK